MEIRLDVHAYFASLNCIRDTTGGSIRFGYNSNEEGQDSDISGKMVNSGTLTNGCSSLSNGESAKVPEYDELQDKVASAASISQGEIVWVEESGPGIDFYSMNSCVYPISFSAKNCSIDFKAAATWEVDGTGATTGVPFSMYLATKAELRCLTTKFAKWWIFPPSTHLEDKENPSVVNLLDLEKKGSQLATEVQAAIWEGLWRFWALQLLVDLLSMSRCPVLAVQGMMWDLEEVPGTEKNDTELLEKACTAEIPEDFEIIRSETSPKFIRLREKFCAGVTNIKLACGLLLKLTLLGGFLQIQEQ
ncbi:hypothetical protein HAX54_045405 [Datura stramonium]|uniref:Uncharacterized protein n=1 Tax=Datura stramonium TaxID=4076 RepID=A0ABS8SQH2_DATST|nr:hypothetical protein [Datura stramonium]